MQSRYTVLAAIAVMAITAAVFQAGATDYWGRKLPNGPTQFIFGYGSLINSQSRNATATNPIPAIPVRVAAGFGYVRAWVDRSASGFTALGLCKPGPGERASTINGVLYPVEGDDMAKFDQREAGYARVAVPHDLIAAVSWQGLPEKAQMWVYVPVGPHGQAGEGLSVATADYPLLQSYIDVVVQGGLEYGVDFARELIETTQDWSTYWLNDRLLARRPWVFTKTYAEVDALLMQTAPASAYLSGRLFTEPFAVRYLLRQTAPQGP